MLSWSSCNQCSAQYSKPLSAFPHNLCRWHWQRWERNESCRNDYHQSSEGILAKPGMEPATSCSQVRKATNWAMDGWLIDWMVFYAAFNSISVISRRQLRLFMLSWVSPVLGWALKCLAQGHSHEKNPEDLVRLEPRTPGFRVKHFTTEPRGTLSYGWSLNLLFWKGFTWAVWSLTEKMFAGSVYVLKKAVQCNNLFETRQNQFVTYISPSVICACMYLRVFVSSVSCLLIRIL